MNSTLVADRNPLERTLQDWVQQAGAGWGVGTPNIGAAFDWIGHQQPDAGAAGSRAPGSNFSASDPVVGPPGYEDWEAVLRSSNAANDELCSENGRLRADAERLRNDERNTTADSADVPEPQSDDAEAFKIDLLASISAAVDDVLSTAAADVSTAASSDVDAAPAAPALSEEPGSGGEGHHEGVDAEADGEQDELAAEAPPSPPAAADAAEATDKVAIVGVAFEEAGRLMKERLDMAVRAAFQEEAERSTPAPSLTAAEETAVLVGERMAMKELVERQHERIRALEADLRDAEVAQANGVLGSAFSMYTQITDAHDALSTGVKQVIKEATKEKKGMATIGTEYEVIGRRGTIVRNGESLRSEVAADLPPGSRVRVVGLSEKYPRRVEIICIRQSGSAIDSFSLQAQPGETDGAGDGTADPGNDGAASPDASPMGSSLSGADPSPVSVVTGWISACDKEGRMLIRAAPKPLEATGGVGSDAEADKEEGDEEIVDVTLSQDEWQALHQDSEASMKKLEALNAKLTKMSYELLQSFEMKSVLSQLHQAIERAHDRCARMGEAAATALQELEQKRFEQLHARQAAEAAAEEAEALACEANDATPSSSSGALCGKARSGQSLNDVGGQITTFEKVDWDRIMTERETTAAALSTGIQRVVTLERECKEIDDEREQLESRGTKDLGGLRGKLRKTVTAMSKVFQAASSSSSGVANSEPLEMTANVAAAEGLFKRRVEDLGSNVADLQAELARSIANERILKRTIHSRRVALRGLLQQGATADLFSTQCGPFPVSSSSDSQRRALQLAVEEQLSCNLSLCNSYGMQQSQSLEQRRSLAMLAKVPVQRQRHR